MTDKYNISDVGDMSPATSKMRLGAYSLNSLKISNGEIYEESKTELRFPRCIKTYDQMALEPTIASALSLLEVLISKAKWVAKVPENAPEEEKQRAEWINKSINNMARPWEEYIAEFLNYLKYGFQPVEKIFEKETEGNFKGKYKPKNLLFISPSTISNWIYNIETGEFAGIRQDLSKIKSDFSRGAFYKNKGLKVDIPRKKFMLFRYSPKYDNPEGVSPLKACYIPWKQKTVIEDYELISAAKDMGGTPIIGVDVEFLSKAGEAGSNEALVLEELKNQAANLHAGEQTYVLKPIAYDDKGKELFTFDLAGVGVSGGGKAYNPDEIIRRNENKILMTFLADVLKLGTESQGSYALADSKTSLLGMGVEHHLTIIKNVLNKEFIRQIYSLNGWDYVQGQSAELCYGDIEKPNLDVLSKFVQRVFSVGAARPTVDVENYLLDLLDLPHKEEADKEFIETENKSRAGESNGTSGTGNSQDGGSSSDTNSENSA